MAMPKEVEGFENKQSLEISNLSFEDSFFRDEPKDSKAIGKKVRKGQSQGNSLSNSLSFQSDDRQEE